MKREITDNEIMKWKKKKKSGNILEIKNEKIVIDMEGGGGWRMVG